MLKNWKAVCKLPGVYLGRSDDFWIEFNRYLEMEKGRGATYYFIPFKNNPGRGKSAKSPGGRACKYDLGELRGEIEKLKKNGCEVGVHGIDAWVDPERGREELCRVQALTGEREVGLRMHWLYFDRSSPAIMEKAGFSYDSTLGYNDAVGYRAGTAQVFKLAGSADFLEIPLHLQDTALFYPDRMNLSADRAMERVQELIDNAEKHGGVLTINWHTRSLSPERLWDDFYSGMLERIERKRVWFATAGQAVRWFRKRRSVCLEGISDREFSLPRGCEDSTGGPDPGLQIWRLQPGGGHAGRKGWGRSASAGPAAFLDPPGRMGAAQAQGQ